VSQFKAVKKIFGTDGIRGRVGTEPITPKTVVQLGWALGEALRAEHGTGTIVIGKDTRISGYMFESSLEAGLSAAGMDVMLIGPLPTPGIAYLTRSSRALAGIVISASHNPYYDNGIKFFSGDGYKLSDELESKIEALMVEPMKIVDAAELGKARRYTDAAGRYIEHCKSTVPDDFSLAGTKIALDCAHGAAYQVGPAVYKELGADVECIGNDPNGVNINSGVGSTHINAIQEHVKKCDADIGISLDGDADRVLLVDADGEVVDGDAMLYLMAKERLRQGEKVPGVVGTLMSNLGIQRAIESMGVEFARAAVGDRYVMQVLHEKGWKLGGESSGHLIDLDKTTTGDGIVSSLQVVRGLKESGKSLKELLEGVSKFPMLMINVDISGASGVDAAALCHSDAIKSAVSEAEKALADSGRVLLRPSGTEPLIRVMIEGQDGEQVDHLCRKVANCVERQVQQLS
jgi:phosphoglucosamine mutase